MLKAARRLIRRGMEITGAIGPYYRAQERRLAAQAAADPIDDGRPMPPSDLLVAVNSAASQRWFSIKGRADADLFADLARRHGVEIERQASVWDWGCGCGRIARWTAPKVIEGGGRFLGSDINPKLVDWCAGALPGEYVQNRLQPPLARPDAAFDLVYAHSVLTHLTEASTRAWLAEVRRLLRPGGVAVLTFHDEDYMEGWAPAQVRAAMRRQPFVVWNNALEGSNYLSSWTTRGHLARMASEHLEVAEIIPGRRDTHAQAIAVLKG